MKHTQDRGFTLIELLVAMAVASIILAAVVSAYQLQVRGNNTQAVLTDMNQATRAALEIMTHEIRAAGCDPLRSANAGVLIADVFPNPAQLSFTMDIGDTAGGTFQPDGVVDPPNDGPNERVRYALYIDGDGNQNLGRSTATDAAGLNGNTQPLVRNVDALDFVFLDAFGIVTATLADIRSIEVTIVARAGETAGGLLFAHTDNTAYVNQRGTVIFTAPGDSFRRFRLTTTINCHNLGLNV